MLHGPRARARPPRARDMINFDKIFVFLQNLENPVHGKPSLYTFWTAEALSSRKSA
jgi:hypothetical protein